MNAQQIINQVEKELRTPFNWKLFYQKFDKELEKEFKNGRVEKPSRKA